MAFPKFHGITLAANSWIENASVERLANDPVPISAGRIWFNTTTRELKFSSLNAGGSVIVEVFATDADVSSALTQLAALGVRVDAIEADYIKKDGSVAFTGDVNLGSHKLTSVANGTNASDAVNLAQVQGLITSLGNAFDYVGTVSGGADGGSAFDMDTLSAKTTGKYYKVTTAGYFKVGVAGTPFYANLNDGLVFNTSGDVDKIDNTDSTVAGTASFIAVSGTTDTGYVVDIDTVFKARVSTLETDLAAEVTRATGAENTLSTNLAAEVTRATGAESTLTTNLSAEISRATTAEGVLQTAITNEASARATADTTLTNDLAAEVTRATNAESTLTTNLASEITRATTAEATLTTDLAAEVTRATAAEGTLTTAVSNLDARVGLLANLNNPTALNIVEAINNVDNKIGNLGNLQTTSQDSIVDAINELHNEALTAQTWIVDELNGKRYLFLSSTPALVHTITHNMGTDYAAVQVWVKGDDLIFRNDIVAVEETNNNTITVTLTEARDVKVIIQDLETISAPV